VRPVCTLVGIALGALAALPAGAQTLLGYQRTAAGDWVCGGVGTEERRQMRALEAEANATLLFVAGRRGGYLAEVAVELRRAGAGEASSLAFTAEGPMCALRLEPGSWRVRARHAGETRERSLRVPAAGRQPARAVFVFPAQPWDGVWASPEEKRSGRE